MSVKLRCAWRAAPYSHMGIYQNAWGRDQDKVRMNTKGEMRYEIKYLMWGY